MNAIADSIKKNLEITNNQTLSTSIYKAMKKTIVLGEIPAGERINESALSEEMNISRTPIRVALEQLVDDQLVKHVQGVGMIVIGISIKDAYEIYDIRKALETLAFTKAMHNMTEEDFMEIKNHLNNADQSYTESRVDDLVQNFSDFSVYVYRKSGMKRLPAIINELQAYLTYFRDLSIRSSERSKDALDEHYLILQGMYTRNEETVKLLVHEHLDRSLAFIITEMEQLNID
ncbi:GntR family transcriptional regulator [Aerococcaceae bacterium 50-4]